MENYLKNHRYITIPTVLFRMGLADVSILVYGYLVNRYMLSLSRNCTDQNGRLYILYPIENMAKDIGKTARTVQRAMKELEDAGLIRVRHRGYKSANIIYVNRPPEIAGDGNVMCGNEENVMKDPTEISSVPRQKCPPINLNKNLNNNNTPSQYSTAYTGYSTPSGRGRGGDRYRKGTDSGMFAPIPDYENCEWYGL